MSFVIVFMLVFISPLLLYFLIRDAFSSSFALAENNVHFSCNPARAETWAIGQMISSGGEWLHSRSSGGAHSNNSSIAPPISPPSLPPPPLISCANISDVNVSSVGNPFLFQPHGQVRSTLQRRRLCVL